VQVNHVRYIYYMNISFIYFDTLAAARAVVASFADNRDVHATVAGTGLLVAMK
jgi:hypothetical protein